MAGLLRLVLQRGKKKDDARARVSLTPGKWAPLRIALLPMANEKN